MSEEYIPALIALYDSLNDDDDEVRDTAAAAAKPILGQAAVPLEAANRLLEFLAKVFNDSDEFKNIVVARLSGARGGAWIPASEQIEAALKVDDALFAVEEQNLFIDEIRETRRWISVLESLEIGVSSEWLFNLDTWLLGGQDRLQQLFELNDGPLGWSSRPQAFAIASSILLCSVSLATTHRCSTQLLDKLRRLKTTLEVNKDKNISGLLVEPLRGLQLG